MEAISLNYPSLNYGSSFPANALDGTGALDTFPVNTSLNYVTSQDMNIVYDAVMNIQAKVGIDNSAVATTLDYLLKDTTGGHDHDGTDSKRLTGLTATHFDSLDGSTITGLDPANFATGTMANDLTMTGELTLNGDLSGAPTGGTLDLTNVSLTMPAVQAFTDVTVTGGITLGADAIDVEKAMCPVGTIIPFYDFNAGLTFDINYWAYCDGKVYTLTGIGAQTVPDLSNRYLVGFGTEAGQDLGTAAWDITPVGNASHQIDLQHTHTGPSHTHDMQNHTHTGPNHRHTGPNHSHSGPNHRHTIAHTHTVNSHSHTSGTIATKLLKSGTSLIYKHIERTSWTPEGRITGITSSAYTTPQTYCTDCFGSTGSTAPSTGASSNANSGYSGTANTGNSGTGNTSYGGTGATGAPSNNTTTASGTGATSSAGSTTQDIQPRSIRVRFIMRIK